MIINQITWDDPLLTSVDTWQVEARQLCLIGGDGMQKGYEGNPRNVASWIFDKKSYSFKKLNFVYFSTHLRRLKICSSSSQPYFHQVISYLYVVGGA